MYVQRCSPLFQLVCLAIVLGCAQAKFGVYMTKIECLNYWPEKIQKFNCWVNRTSKITGSFSVEMSFAEDINNATGSYTLYVKQGPSLRQYLSINMDCCKIISSLQSNYALKMLLTELRRSSNFPLECPFKMSKIYNIKDFFVDTKVIPSYAPELDFLASTQLNISNKQAGQVNIYARLARA